MKFVKLIRYANEGFINHKQEHIHSSLNPIIGSFAFIDKEEVELLSYKDSYNLQNNFLYLSMLIKIKNIK